MSVHAVGPAVAQGRVAAPPSKSYTHRALVAAFLARERCSVVDPLRSDDTCATAAGLRALGADIIESRRSWRVCPTSSRPAGRHPAVKCRESGTTLRLLAAVASLGLEPVRFTGSAQLASRPTAPLYDALRDLGATVETPDAARSVPCVIRGPLRAGHISLRADVSSQFASALLLALPAVAGDSEIHLVGPVVSRPYLEATVAFLRTRGVEISGRRRIYRVAGGQAFRSGQVGVPGDASSAAYLWAAAAVSGGRVEVTGIDRRLPQADLALLPILRSMGAKVGETADRIAVEGPVRRGVVVELSDAPDLFPLVSVLAALVPRAQSRLLGAPQLAFKESDRRAESARLARALGAKVRVSARAVEISGTAAPRPLDLRTLQDHRLVMSAAVGALVTNGLSRIGRAEAVRKSFPGFWKTLARLTGEA